MSPKRSFTKLRFGLLELFLELFPGICPGLTS